MVTPVDLSDHHNALGDLLRCSICHSQLTLTGKQFVCPQNEEGPTSKCETKATNADALIRAIMGKFVTRLMNDQVTETIVEDAQRDLPETRSGQNFPGLSLGMELPTEEEMEAIWMRDKQKMKETALDPRTYLDYAEPQETSELLRNFINEILVGPDSVELAYRVPMPDSDNHPVVTRDLVLL